jgi:hypothetical protein
MRDTVDTLEDTAAVAVLAIRDTKTNNYIDNEQQGSSINNVVQPPLAHPPTKEQEEDNYSTSEPSPQQQQQIFTPVEQTPRESQSYAANKLQGGDKNVPMIQQPQQPPLAPLHQQQQLSGSRRQKLQQELADARRYNSPPLQNQSPATEEMPISTTRTINNDEIVKSQEQQQQLRDVVQSGLRGGDSQRGEDVVELQLKEEEETTLKELLVVPEHEDDLAALERGGLKNDQLQLVAGEVMIPETAAVERVVPPPLLPPPPPPPPPQQQQSPKPLPKTFSFEQMNNIPDAIKNTIEEMGKKDIKEGKEKGYHYKELMEQKKREAELRREKLTVAANNNNNSNNDLGGIIVRPPPRAFRIDGPDNAQRFAEYIAQKKAKMIRKEKIRHPIQAIVGSGGGNDSNSNGNVRTKDMSSMKNYKAQIHQKQQHQQKPDLRPEAQPTKRVGEKILGKIPLVKRAFKRTPAFETLNDAALSFTRGLQMGVFRNNNHALDTKRKAALLDWLDLLSISLPPELGLHELIDTLKHNMDLIAQSPSNLKVIIDKHPIPDSYYSKSCTKGIDGQGFFCGFWKLLHVASVGFAEQQGGLMLRELHPNIRVFSPKEAGAVLREYMGMFFNCEKCSKRFIAQYDECKFQSCERLIDKTDDATAESWKEFPLWLWEVHNDVSRSKAERTADFHEKASRKAEAKKWERYMGAVYPHLDQCIRCWTAEGTWDLNAIYNHLEREYWTFGVEVDSKMESLLDYKDATADGVSRGLGAYLGLGIVVLLTYFLKKYKIRASGRHKKQDEIFFPRESRDGRIKYRDS